MILLDILGHMLSIYNWFLSLSVSPSPISGDQQIVLSTTWDWIFLEYQWAYASGVLTIYLTKDHAQ